MKTVAKNLTVFLTVLLMVTGFAMGENLVTNSGFETWTSGPDNWTTDGGAITLTQETTTVKSGLSSCKVDFTSTSNQYLRSNTFAVTAGSSITASVWMYDNDVAGRGRLCILYPGASNYYGAYSTDQDSWQELTYSSTVPAGATEAQIELRFYDVTWDGDCSIFVDDVTYDHPIISSPTITLSESSLTGFSYEIGNGPSASQSFTVTGTSLSSDITISPSTNYEISEDDVSFQSTDITLTQSGGSVSSTPVYVRLKSGLSINDYTSEYIIAASSGATSDTVLCSGSVTEILPDIVINEILADPDVTNGDANGDETVDASQDEFVELVNKDGSNLDISGWKIYDGYGVRHVFPEGTILANNISIVVFGGGTPTGIPGLSQTASTGALGLNNTADDVIVKNSTDVVIVSYTYGSEAGDNQSIARDPDFTGDFVKHSTITENPVLFSPGEMNSVADTPLPITLSSFTATTKNGAVELLWATASETNNACFVIYRNGEAIGSVEGAGTTSEPHSYIYVDDTVIPGVAYTYILADVDYANEETKYESNAVTVTVDNGLVEADFVVGAAFPNPFNPATVVPIELSGNATVKASLYDLTGREVKALINANYTAGTHELHIDGSGLTTGTYLLHVVIDNVTNIQKIALMK